MIGRICDEALRQELNNNNQNYWDVYIGEINEQLGLCSAPYSLRELEHEGSIGEGTALFIGRQSGQRLTRSARENLHEWVENGGLLIGFAVEGLDEVFGIETRRTVQQPRDDFTASGYFSLGAHTLTQGIHSAIAPSQELLIFSDISVVTPDSSEQIAG